MTRTFRVCAGVAMLTMTMQTMLVQAQEKKQGDGGNGPSLKGRGTPGHLAAWLDGRTLGDSVVAEIDGLLGIGTTTPESKVTVVHDASFNAVLRVINIGTSGVAVQADGSDQTIDAGGEGIAATGGDSPVRPGEGILTSGGNSPFVRGGNGIVTFGGGSGVEGAPGSWPPVEPQAGPVARAATASSRSGGRRFPARRPVAPACSTAMSM